MPEPGYEDFHNMKFAIFSALRFPEEPAEARLWCMASCTHDQLDYCKEGDMCVRWNGQGLKITDCKCYDLSLSGGGKAVV